MSGRSDDELADLLRDLERDLDRLTDRLNADDEAGDRSRNRNDRHGDRGSARRRTSGHRRSERGPRPPSPGDLLRFTEEYTIPTVISMLEATVQSLELLRGGLRLADPTRRADDAGRSGDRDRNRVGVRGRVARELGGGASVAVERTLSDLRAALSAADLPEDEGGDGDGDAREILEDARSLTDEIERRLDGANRAHDARRGADADRSERSDRRRPPERDRTRREGEDRDRDRRRRGSARRGVGIEVRDAGESDADGEDGDVTEADTMGENETDEGDDAPQVDVDAELESIRREVGEERDLSGGAGADEAEGDESDENDGNEGNDDSGA